MGAGARIRPPPHATRGALADRIIIIEEERLPFKEGWRTPKTQISGFSIASDVLQLALLTPEKVSDYGDRFTGNNGTLPVGGHGGVPPSGPGNGNGRGFDRQGGRRGGRRNGRNRGDRYMK